MFHTFHQVERDSSKLSSSTSLKKQDLVVVRDVTVSYQKEKRK